MGKANNLGEFMTDLADAIREKTGTTEPINPQDFSQKILDLGGEAVAKSPNSIVFYDYDGTILYSYTKDEFLALTEMPTLPTKKGLVCQGWNYSFEEAVAYAGEYGVLNVGALYITDDGKTRIYISIVAEGRMDVPLNFYQSGSKVEIDWGDGKTQETLNTNLKNLTHQYAELGNYVITLNPIDNCVINLGEGTSSYCLIGTPNDHYSRIVTRVEIGRNVQKISNYAFNNNFSLTSVTIPQGVLIDGQYALMNCRSLPFIALPQGVSSGNPVSFSGCYALKGIALPTDFFNSLSPSSIFSSTAVRRLVIPDSCTLIPASFAYSCVGLSSIIIPKSVTEIALQAFRYCSGFRFFDFSHHTELVTLKGSNCLEGIPSDCKIIVPDDLYSSWQGKQYWSSIKSQIIKKTDWDALQA